SPLAKDPKYPTATTPQSEAARALAQARAAACTASGLGHLLTREVDDGPRMLQCLLPMPPPVMGVRRAMREIVLCLLEPIVRPLGHGYLLTRPPHTGACVTLARGSRSPGPSDRSPRLGGYGALGS